MSSIVLARCRSPLSLIPVFSDQSTKPPTAIADGGSCGQREPDDYLLSHGQSALSSAWSCFTVLFGMGRGGTNSLWSSGITCCHAAHGSHARGSQSGKKYSCNGLDGQGSDCADCGTLANPT